MDILVKKDAFKEEIEDKHPNLIAYCCPCCGSEDIYRCESDYGDCDRIVKTLCILCDIFVCAVCFLFDGAFEGAFNECFRPFLITITAAFEIFLVFLDRFGGAFDDEEVEEEKKL